MHASSNDAQRSTAKHTKSGMQSNNLLSFALLLPTGQAFVTQSHKSISFNGLRAHPVITDAADFTFFNHADVAVSTLVSHSATPASDTVPFLPVLGSSLIMLSIVALLYCWEKSIEWIRTSVPFALLPVVESILAEIGGLGFIGLILQTVGGAINLEELSIKLFGEADILLEVFEFLHNAFFQVGVGFFMAAGAMVAVGLKKLAEIKTIQGLLLNEKGECTVTPDILTEYLPTIQDANEPPYESLWHEINMSTEERAGKVLLMRHRVMEQHDLPNTFLIEQYVQGAFAENLLEIVEFSPLTWIYLIPALALANSVDLSHDVVNSASPNAAESVGYFFSTPWVIWPSLFTVVLSLVWGTWNCRKLTDIKYMLLPRLGRNPDTGKTEILPPPIDIDSLRESFVSSPSWVQPIEALWSKPATTKYEKLFGTAGAAGLDLYRNSIQLQSWLCITNIVFFGTQIVPRDMSALLTGAEVGDPAYLTVETVTYGSFVLLSLIQLIFITSRAFWNLCLVSCAKDGASEELLAKSIVSID